MTKLDQLADLGQSIWLDYIQRSLIDSGGLAAWIAKGVRGVTSNPSIFEKAIAGSPDYDDDVREMVVQGRSVAEIYEDLVLDDVSAAADLLRPVYDRTGGLDGYVSLEANPHLARDDSETVAEIQRLQRALSRPNVMFKVPATPEGMPAIEALIASGVNVNVTLIFSLAQYQAVAEAYLSGLEKRLATGQDVSRIASVASFFVSRVDGVADQALERVEETALQGRTAVANAQVAYARFLEILGRERWKRLAARGARVQRVLWGSTSTKNHRYPDTMYVDRLIGRDTVNTVPPPTLDLFLDHGTVAPTLMVGLDEAEHQLQRLAELGIDLDAITRKLLDDGVTAFVNDFDRLLASISAKRQALLGNWGGLALSLGPYQAAVDQALAQLRSDRVMERMWARDHTVWKTGPAEIANRLGWLDIAERMLSNTDRLEALAEALTTEGYTDAVLLGMGGSSLAPQVFYKVFGHRGSADGSRLGLHLTVLDSTDPASVLAVAEQTDPAKTLFVVSTKSGATAETLSFFKFFYNRVAEALGTEQAGRHFVAITDPGTELASLASEYGFRTALISDPNIGGRYSALSYFGLLPAALVGVDVRALLDRSLALADNCKEFQWAMGQTNPGAVLGAVMAELTCAGRDKLTLILSPRMSSFGDWVEQLIAESTGKEGKGILPIVGEHVGLPGAYGTDRLFVYVRSEDGQDVSQLRVQDAAIQALQDAGHPVVRLGVRDVYDIGQQFFLWEMATAVACHLMGINPFDQPNVEAAKNLARRMASEYIRLGSLPDGEWAPLSGASLASFLTQAQPNSYIALQAYVQPTAEVDAALLSLRIRLRSKYGLATTVGYGPRFLHSTGQLHKGDAGNGLFVQLVSSDARDVAIPDKAGAVESSITFGVLKAAQALGDWQALREAGRKVIRFHLSSQAVDDINTLVQGL
jgi:transaldolase/glucose-6-phosphate isomerase